MATYIMLCKYTQQGLTKIKEGPGRIELGRKIGHALGAELKAWYLVMGPYDVISIWEAPNDEVLAKASLALGSAGNITTQTLRAFNENEFRDIVASLT